MRLLITFFAIFIGGPLLHSQSFTSYFTGSEIDKAVDNQQFALTVMGGGTEVDYAMRLFLQDANGGDILVLRTSGSDGYNDYMYSELGIDVNSVETIVCHNRDASSDPYVLERILKAEAIWFAGGDQWEFLSFWRDTPLQQYINFALLDKGIAVGGTSAGMAILGHYQFTAENGTVTSEQALANPYDVRITIDNRPFLIMPLAVPIILDPHFDELDRKGRMATFMARIRQDYNEYVVGIGLDEDTAARLEFGYQILFMDDTFEGYDNKGHIFTYDCTIDPTEFVVENKVELSWLGDHLKYGITPAAPIGSLAFGLINSFENFNFFGKYNVNINVGVYDQEDFEYYYTYFSLPCSVLTDTENQEIGNISLFPNPGSNTLRIETNYSKIEYLKVVSSGGTIADITATDIQSGNILDISYLPPGIYYLIIQLGNTLHTQNFIKI